MQQKNKKENLNPKYLHLNKLTLTKITCLFLAYIKKLKIPILDEKLIRYTNRIIPKFSLIYFVIIKCRTNIAQMFSIMHKSVSDQSKKMYLEIRRNNFVTPTNFLELTSGYKT